MKRQLNNMFYCTNLKDLRERFLPWQPYTQNTLFGTVSQLRTYHFHYMSTSCWITKKKKILWYTYKNRRNMIILIILHEGKNMNCQIMPLFIYIFSVTINDLQNKMFFCFFKENFGSSKWFVVPSWCLLLCVEQLSSSTS